MLKFSKWFGRKKSRQFVDQDETISTPPLDLSEWESSQDEDRESSVNLADGKGHVVLVQIVAMIDIDHASSLVVHLHKTKRKPKVQIDLQTNHSVSSHAIYYTDLNKAPVLEICSSEPVGTIHFKLRVERGRVSSIYAASLDIDTTLPLQVVHIGETGALVVRVTDSAKHLACPEAVLLTTSLHMLESGCTTHSDDSIDIDQLAWIPMGGSAGFAAALTASATLREKLDVLATRPSLLPHVRARIIRGIANNADPRSVLSQPDARSIERLVVGAGDSAHELKRILDCVGSSMKWNLPKLVFSFISSDSAAQERVIKHLNLSDAPATSVFIDYEDGLTLDLLNESVMNPGMLSLINRLDKSAVVVCSGRPHGAAEKIRQKLLSRSGNMTAFSCIYPTVGEASAIPELFLPNDMHRTLLFPNETVVYIGSNVALARRLDAEKKLKVAFITCEMKAPDSSDKLICVTNAVGVALEAAKAGLLSPADLRDVMETTQDEVVRVKRSLLAKDEFLDRTRQIEDLNKKIRADSDQALGLSAALSGVASGDAEQTGNMSATDQMTIRRVNALNVLMVSPPESVQETSAPSESEEIAEIRNFTFLSTFQ